jgi:hypothetical protein
VPPKYALLPWNKYAEAAATPMAQAGTVGVLLAVLLVFSVFFHLQSASIVFCVGPELSLARVRYERRRAILLSVARGEQTAEAAADADRVAEGVVSEERKAVTSRRIFRAASLRAISKPGGFAAGGAPSYGAVASDDPAVLPGEVEMSGVGGDGGSGGDSDAPGALPPSAEATSTLMLSTFRSASARSRGYASAPSTAQSFARKQIEERLAAIADLAALEKSADLETRDLGARVKTPSARALVRTLEHDARSVWGSHTRCLMLSLVAVSIFVGGLAGGLSKVSIDDTCTRLATNTTLVTATYNTSFPLLMNLDPTEFYAGLITISNSYAKGTIEVSNEHVVPELQSVAPTVYIELTYFSASAKELPSQASAFAAVAALGLTQPTDPALTGYANINITLAPPAGSSPCLGVRLRVWMTSYNVRLAVNSKNAAVIIRGNAVDVDPKAPGAWSSFNVRDATRAIG